MTVDATDLYDVGRIILGAIEDAAVAQGYILPDRRYVTVGGSVYDCKQVVVSALSADTGLNAATGQPLDNFDSCPPVWRATFEAGIVLTAVEAVEGQRGTLPPKVEKVEDDTKAMSRAFSLLAAASQALSDKGYARVTSNIAFGQPQGGLIAAVATIGVNLWA